MSTVRSISAQDLQSLDMRQVCIIDVRTPMEYMEKRLAVPTVLAPVNELDPKDVALRHGLLEDTPIVTLCASGRRATAAATKFMDAGFSDVRVIDGGLAACQQAGVPTVGQAPAKGKTAPSLDRQVRFAAGSLVASFFLLGYFVHAIFYLGVLFVAGGLIFSGITNWCGMALLLARAPWNKQTSCAINGPKPGASCQ